MANKPSDRGSAFPQRKAQPSRSNPTTTPSSNTQTPMATPIAFISAPADPDSACFAAHYAPALHTAIAQGHRFVIGPSRGVDTLAFEHLRRAGVAPRRIALYLNVAEETQLKPVFKGFEEAGGRLVMVKGGHAERDEAMTRAPL